jgi:NAD(P)-dependent dehydrogenase (short-subunit alcohol dehydrogenase family)
MSQVVLVTGCSSGLGRELVQRLSAAGYAVAATARRLESLVDLPAAAKLPLDVTRCESIHQAVGVVLERFGRIDVLVNNAGHAVFGAVEEISDEQVQRLFDVNVFGALRLIRAVVPAMRERRAGRLINISSVSGRLVVPANGPYSATKFALEALSDALRWELAPFGIQVVVVEPASIKTGFAEKAEAQAEAILANPLSPYEPLYARSHEVSSNMRRHEPGPEVVARVVEQAIEATHPCARYIAGFPMSGRIMLGLGAAAWDVAVKQMYQVAASRVDPSRRR